jgi:hypothetical protein
LIDIKLLETGKEKPVIAEQTKQEEIKKEQAEVKTSQEMQEEKKEERKEEIKEEKSEPQPNINPETQTLKKPERELSSEEREKIRKIAAGFFAGGSKEQ